MSRVGKKPVPIPKGVEVTLKDGIVYAKGPKGGLQQAVHETPGLGRLLHGADHQSMRL